MDFKNRLWTIAARRPKSQRFSQVSFDGFRPRGNNIFERFISTFVDFGRFLAKYGKRKTSYLLSLGGKTGVLAVTRTWLLKNFLVRKLIWSRGKLGRPIATSIVMSVAFLVFMFGKVFNSSRLVISKEIDPGYLSNVTDIIPQRNIAITTVPESRKSTEPFVYVIEPGDTLSTIGERFKISSDALEYVNGLTDSSVLKVGQELTVPPVSGLIHTVESGDSLSSIAEKYDVPPQAVADFNYILNTSQLAIGTELVIPGAKVPEPVIFVSPDALTSPAIARPGFIDPGASKGWCIWPTTTRIITQYYTWYHNGIDISTPRGFAMPPVYTCAGGVVTRAGWDPWGLGLHVTIDHGNGYETTYGHLNRIDVGFGSRVGRGQAIGVMGSTGRSTGPHVHFLLRYQGVPQNPLNYIQ